MTHILLAADQLNKSNRCTVLGQAKADNRAESTYIKDFDRTWQDFQHAGRAESEGMM